MKLSGLREEYSPRALHREDFPAEPFMQFEQWFDEALAAELPEPNAMSLATVDEAGRPLLRTVLLKEFDAKGFVFYTNYHSAKATQIAGHPQVCLLFPWIPLMRQVIICGRAEKISREESQAYFSQRPRASQIGAWVSHQSSVIAGREVLKQKLAELEERFAQGEVPLPPFWGGFRVHPISIEFWQGGPGRLHDRLRYRRESETSDDWILERLSP